MSKFAAGISFVFFAPLNVFAGARAALHSLHKLREKSPWAERNSKLSAALIIFFTPLAYLWGMFFGLFSMPHEFARIKKLNSGSWSEAFKACYWEGNNIYEHDNGTNTATYKAQYYTWAVLTVLSVLVTLVTLMYYFDRHLINLEVVENFLGMTGVGSRVFAGVLLGLVTSWAISTFCMVKHWQSAKKSGYFPQTNEVDNSKLADRLPLSPGATPDKGVDLFRDLATLLDHDFSVDLKLTFQGMSMHGLGKGSCDDRDFRSSLNIRNEKVIVVKFEEKEFQLPDRPMEININKPFNVAITNANNVTFTQDDVEYSAAWPVGLSIYNTFNSSFHSDLSPSGSSTSAMFRPTSPDVLHIYTKLRQDLARGSEHVGPINITVPPFAAEDLKESIVVQAACQEFDNKTISLKINNNNQIYYLTGEDSFLLGTLPQDQQNSDDMILTIYPHAQSTDDLHSAFIRRPGERLEGGGAVYFSPSNHEPTPAYNQTTPQDPVKFKKVKP